MTPLAQLLRTTFLESDASEWSDAETWEAIARAAEAHIGVESQPTRQSIVLKWALDNFGQIALNRDERAARLLEEAAEVAQAEGLRGDLICRILNRVYSRPAGQLSQEIGGLAITLDALAENAGLSVETEANRELARILALPPDWWKRKHAEKVAAGVADLSVAGTVTE